MAKAELINELNAGVRQTGRGKVMETGKASNWERQTENKGQVNWKWWMAGKWYRPECGLFCEASQKLCGLGVIVTGGRQ